MRRTYKPTAEELRVLRALKTRNGPPTKAEMPSAVRLVDAGLLVAVSRTGVIRPTPAGRKTLAAHKPKRVSLMQPGPGTRFDCVHAGVCLSAFIVAYSHHWDGHCPPACAHRQDVVDRPRVTGDSPIAACAQWGS